MTLTQQPNKDVRAIELLSSLESSFALSVLNSSPDCIKIIELDGSLSFMNRNGMCAMEIDDFCVVDAKPWPSLWPAEAQHLIDDAVMRARGGETVCFDAYCPTAKGAARWWAVTVAPIKSARGAAERLLATSRDITDRVQREQRIHDHERQITKYAEQLAAELKAKDVLIAEKELLSREIDHRVKNSLNQVVSILRLQSRSRSDGDSRQVLEDAAQRVSTIARIHERLSLSEDVQSIEMGPFLSNLASDIHGGAVDGDHYLSVDVMDFVLPSDRAVPLGLVTAELLSNALKHACSDRETSRIAISLQRASTGKGIVLSIEDDGPGLDDRVGITQGLGMRICTVYAAQLGGQLKTSRGRLGGARFEVELPLA